MVNVSTTNEVVADFQELIQAGFEGVWSDDYVIWCDGRIMAVIHRSMDREEQKLFLFNEPHNDPIAGRAIDPMPYWPTYEEWVESGRGDLWKTDRLLPSKFSEPLASDLRQPPRWLSI